MKASILNWEHANYIYKILIFSTKYIIIKYVNLKYTRRKNDK